jgi:Flp pilus assembly protein TadB
MEDLPKAEVSVRVDADAVPEPLRDALAPSTAAPPVPAQRASHVNAAKLESEKVVISAPLSYAGSAARIWKLTGLTESTGARIALGVAAVILILGAWCFVTAWYVVFGLLLVPYRLIRRGSRKRKREALQHRETLAAIQSRNE